MELWYLDENDQADRQSYSPTCTPGLNQYMVMITEINSVKTFIQCLNHFMCNKEVLGQWNRLEEMSFDMISERIQGLG